MASGPGHQVLLSQDICFRDLLATNGGRGYTCLLDDFLPWLVARGTIDEPTARGSWWTTRSEPWSASRSRGERAVDVGRRPRLSPAAP